MSQFWHDLRNVAIGVAIGFALGLVAGVCLAVFAGAGLTALGGCK